MNLPLDMTNENIPFYFVTLLNHLYNKVIRLPSVLSVYSIRKFKYNINLTLGHKTMNQKTYKHKKVPAQ